MINASRNPILTTHVGSLIRPQSLIAYMRAMESGIEVDRKAYDRCLAESVAEVVERQIATGIDIVSDGEFGKFRTWSYYIMDRLAGFEERQVTPIKAGGRDAELFPEFCAEYFPGQNLPDRGVAACIGPIEYQGRTAIRKDIDNFKAALKDKHMHAAFLPVVAPASAVPRYVNEHYESDEAFFFALAEALRQEYLEIVNAGLMVQVDDAFLPYMYDVAFRDRPLEDYKRWARLRVEALNHALRDLPLEQVRYHVCWGSFNAPHVGDIPFRDIADLVLSVNAGAYCIEMANPRHAHEWRVWEELKLPDGRKLIPGVVSHCTNVVEHPELIAERLCRLARLLGRDNIIAGTDCGFAQGPFVRRVHPSIQWAKLEALVEGAKIASGSLGSAG